MRVAPISADPSWPPRVQHGRLRGACVPRGVHKSEQPGFYLRDLLSFHAVTIPQRFYFGNYPNALVQEYPTSYLKTLFGADDQLRSSRAAVGCVLSLASDRNARPYRAETAPLVLSRDPRSPRGAQIGTA